MPVYFTYTKMQHGDPRDTPLSRIGTPPPSTSKGIGGVEGAAAGIGVSGLFRLPKNPRDARDGVLGGDAFPPLPPVTLPPIGRGASALAQPATRRDAGGPPLSLFLADSTRSAMGPPPPHLRGGTASPTLLLLLLRQALSVLQ